MGNTVTFKGKHRIIQHNACPYYLPMKAKGQGFVYEFTGKRYFTSHVSFVISSSSKLWYFFCALTSSIWTCTASS